MDRRSHGCATDADARRSSRGKQSKSTGPALFDSPKSDDVKLCSCASPCPSCSCRPNPPAAPPTPPTNPPPFPCRPAAGSRSPAPASLSEKILTGYVEHGWTPRDWRTRLEQLAGLCERDHPSHARDLRQWAAAIVVGLILTTAYAAVPESWVRETARLESRGNTAAVGDRGRSRGAYQIQQATWVRYSRTPWVTGAHDPCESRRVAGLILADCVRACRRDRRAVTFANARWYYRHGGF